MFSVSSDSPYGLPGDGLFRYCDCHSSPWLNSQHMKSMDTDPALSAAHVAPPVKVGVMVRVSPNAASPGAILADAAQLKVLSAGAEVRSVTTPPVPAPDPPL